MTWATWFLDVPGTFASFIRCIAAPIVESHLARTCPNTPCPRRITRIVLSHSRCDLSSKTACPTKLPVGISGVITAFLSLTLPSKTGWRPGGKKAAHRIDADYLDWAMADFSGYIAIDEVYDGPFCILSLVDNRTFKRILYQVLDHDPDHTDIIAFLRRFQAVLTSRDLTLEGITTDGSPLYPEPLRLVFPDVPHQLCEFHILKDLTKAILRAVAQIRKKLAAQKPAAKRGRPSTKEAKRIVRRRKQLQQKIADLFEHRYVFVQHDQTPVQQRTLHRIPRGQPQLRILRQIMEEVYRLFDRRCRTDTALAKLAQLRRRVCRFKKVGTILRKLQSSNLEKALTYLDDKLFPSTSNAVERGNRRFRKMQKTVYRVRTQENITNRIAMDLLRDAQKAGRTCTMKTLHKTRGENQKPPLRC
jgi:hypothetical protein